MATDDNWIHDESIPAYRRIALMLQEKRREWEKGKVAVYRPHPTITHPPTWIVSYEPIATL
jgi:hypothetical protein